MQRHQVRRSLCYATGAAASAAALAVAPSVSAAAGNTANAHAAASKIRLAAEFANTSDPFFETQLCAAKAEAKKLGVSLQTFSSTSTDTNQIANAFQSAALTKPQGIFANPFDNNQFLAQYKRLMKSGVPIVSNNGTSPPAEYKYVLSGSSTGQFAAQVLKKVPTTGSMVYLGGAPGIPPLESRTTPFIKAVEKLRPQLKVLPTEYSGFSVTKVATDLNSILLANPQLKLIIVADGPDAEGAASALKAAGDAGKITVVAFDAIPPEVAALKAGTISDLIAQDPTAIATTAISDLVTYLRAHPHGGAVKYAGQQMIPNKLLTASNVGSSGSKPFIYKASC